MALEGPAFSSFIILVLSATAASITIDLILYQKRFLLQVDFETPSGGRDRMEMDQALCIEEEEDVPSRALWLSWT
jgi:hypothetical protein